jgi:hypothetical protein
MDTLETYQCRGAVAEPSSKRGVGRTHAQFRHATFLEEKVGDCTLEGWVSHVGEIGGGVIEILTEPAVSVERRSSSPIMKPRS